ncbi:hypothetical protein [Saccharopolyspora spinosa]|uniref:Uncharacterized protein n=2 Tax=Saccharopolyspora spinosa TaxID=60894 RepID=A0A2N3Y2K8_SACSN|nr:hypothetical protein [Saccharopolyspora spinosa]PKW17142.1 hypothetical protein A8926_5074 [Saccharopolyspora spinosa]
MMPSESQVLPGGFGYPLGFASGFVVVTACIAVDETARPAAAVVLLAILVAIVSALTTVPAATATAAVCWALFATFSIGVRGDLTVDGSTVVGLGILLLAAVVGLIAGAVSRARRRHSAAQSTPFVPAPRQPSVSERLSH